MTACVCVLFHLPSNPECGEPAVAQVTTGCVHEHIEQDWMCTRHAAMAKRNELICSECKTGRLAHSCQVFGLAEVDEAGERRILVGASTACPSCLGTFPGEGPDEWVCRCGSGWAADAGAHEGVAARTLFAPSTPCAGLYATQTPPERPSRVSVSPDAHRPAQPLP